MATLNDIETKVQSIIDILKSRIVKTITGILPLTFTANAGNAIDWSISGNDEPGTENLVEVVIEKANISDTGIIVSNPSFNMCVAKIVEGREYTITTSSSSGFVYGLFSTLPTIDSQSYDNNRVIGQRTFTAPIDGYIAFRCMLNDTSVMLTEGSTAPDHYIPYQQGVGELVNDHYEIPLSVNGSTVNIPIGSSPLTAGQSVSKTSTGVDLELFEGENTVSTTLYNKPEMTIKYKYNGGN